LQIKVEEEEGSKDRQRTTKPRGGVDGGKGLVEKLWRKLEEESRERQVWRDFISSGAGARFVRLQASEENNKVSDS
jgi:hypothetical protein